MLCGGNIEPLVLAEIIQRGMVKSGRLARLRWTCATCPARWPTWPPLLGRLGANIDEVQHQRAFSTLSVERAQIEVVVQTRGAAHVEEILAVDARAGLPRRTHRLGSIAKHGLPGCQATIAALSGTTGLKRHSFVAPRELLQWQWRPYVDPCLHSAHHLIDIKGCHGSVIKMSFCVHGLCAAAHLRAVGRAGSRAQCHLGRRPAAK